MQSCLDSSRNRLIREPKMEEMFENVLVLFAFPSSVPFESLKLKNQNEVSDFFEKIYVGKTLARQKCCAAPLEDRPNACRFWGSFPLRLQKWKQSSFFMIVDLTLAHISERLELFWLRLFE